MSCIGILQVIMIVLKLVGLIQIGWLAVFTPTIVMGIMITVFATITIWQTFKNK